MSGKIATPRRLARSRRLAAAWTVGVIIVAASLSSHAETQAGLRVEGLLRTSAGAVAPDGKYNLTFALYSNKQDTKAKFTFVESAVAVAKGLFAVTIGGGGQLAKGAFAKAKVGWIGITVEKDAELPRLAMHRVPYAFVAQSAGELACSGCVSNAHLGADVLKSIGDSAKAAAANAKAIGTIGKTVGGLNTAVAANGKAIATLNTTVGTQGKTLLSHSSAIGDNGKSIAAHGKTLATHGKTLATHNAAIASNGKKIAANLGLISANKAALSKKADTAKLAKVAFSGSHSDLANKPVTVELGKSCPSGQVMKGLSKTGKIICGTLAPALPKGMIAYFPDKCPAGWAEFTSARGRVIVATHGTSGVGLTRGGALKSNGARTITDVPAHKHVVDPPSTNTSSAGTHSHSVDPPNTGTTGAGGHSHSVNPPGTWTRSGDGKHHHRAYAPNHDSNSANSQGYPANNNHQSFRTSDRGRDRSVHHHAIGTAHSEHRHYLDIGSFNSGGVGNHSHAVNIGKFNSASAGNHGHSVNIGAFLSATSGKSSVEVTMPYIQLIACRKN